MDDVTNVQIIDCKNSKFLKPLRMLYCQNGKKKAWDALKVHDSVAILIYNTTRKVLIFVKQFRPAIYINRVKITKDEEGNDVIDHNAYPGSLGLTYELCAGIVDKDKTLEQIACEEILEECGYDVPSGALQRITGFRNGVGTSGAQQDLYFAEVTDEMKVGPGGGSPDEGEFIEIVEIPVSEGQAFIMDESYIKPVQAMFGLLWFYQNIYDKTK